jgi:hypothetical protein
MRDAPDPSDADPTLPPSLMADLGRLHRAPAVPPAVDAAVRRQARSYFAGQRRVRLWTRWGGAAAAAAVLAIGLRVAVFDRSQSADLKQAATKQATTRQQALAGDVDGSGAVDILDAFSVARGVKAGRTLPEWDANHDGVVDQKDVDLIAGMAVAARGGRR